MMAFARFLLSAIEEDTHYLVKALTSDLPRAFDGERTVSLLQKELLLHRRSREITKEDARREWEVLAQGFESQAAFQRWLPTTQIEEARECEVVAPPQFECKCLIRDLFVPHLVPALRAWLDIQTSSRSVRGEVA